MLNAPPLDSASARLHAPKALLRVNSITRAPVDLALALFRTCVGGRTSPLRAMSRPLTLDGLQRNAAKAFCQIICYTLYLVFKEPATAETPMRRRRGDPPPTGHPSAGGASASGEPYEVTTDCRFRQARSSCRTLELPIRAAEFTSAQPFGLRPCGLGARQANSTILRIPPGPCQPVTPATA